MNTGVSRTASTLAWGLFCASSWTWCIGMFLPLLLFGIFGAESFLVFAIPNVIGCTAFGYVVSAKRSKGLVEAHARPMRVFAFTTIAFQVFFLGYGSALMLFNDASSFADTWPVLGIVLTMGAAALASSRRGNTFWLGFAVAATVAAIALFIALLTFVGGFPDVSTPSDAPSLAAAAPALMLGFLLCPYLDPTFHRARQAAPSRHAFFVFGVVFSFMLIFVAATFDPATIGPVVLPIVFAQWMIQLVFTAGAHLRELAELPRAVFGANLSCLAALGLGVVLGLPGVADERIYLAFLGFYTIPFPLYVLVALVAGPQSTLPPKAFIAILLVSAALSPLAWLGFVEEQTPLLLWVFGVVLLAGGVIGRVSRPTCRTLSPAT
jgi:hypothetical protein